MTVNKKHRFAREKQRMGKFFVDLFVIN